MKRSTDGDSIAPSRRRRVTADFELTRLERRFVTWRAASACPEAWHGRAHCRHTVELDSAPQPTPSPLRSARAVGPAREGPGRERLPLFFARAREGRPERWSA